MRLQVMVVIGRLQAGLPKRYASDTIALLVIDRRRASERISLCCKTHVHNRYRTRGFSRQPHHRLLSPDGLGATVLLTRRPLNSSLPRKTKLPSNRLF